MATCTFAFILLTVLSACVTPTQRTQRTQPTQRTTAWAKLPQRLIHHTAFRHYATVTRSDGSIRHMLIDEAALQRWQPGQPLPPAALIIMQTWPNAGTETTNFTRRVAANGDFTYGSFDPSQPSFATRADPECASCHALSEDGPGTFTLALLNAAVTQGRLMTTQCDRAGRIPCESEVYRHFAPAN